jgi:hypothetical protein
MGYGRLLSNKPLLVNDTMRRPLSSTSSGNHRLSIENDIDKILCKALGKNVVSTISKMNTLGMMNPFYDGQDILFSSTNSVHQPVFIERDDGEEGDANIIEEDDTLDTISCTSSSSSDDGYSMVSQPQSHDHIFIRYPSPPYKIHLVAFHPSKKISEVKNEIQTLLGLHPTEGLAERTFR